MNLLLEQQASRDVSPLRARGLLITPQIDKDYWTFRVKVSETQAIVGFPKFTTIGIGFQIEADWNTNLPYFVCAERIYQHIKHNTGEASIPKARVIKAIQMVQAATIKMRRETQEPCLRDIDCTSNPRRAADWERP